MVPQDGEWMVFGQQDECLLTQRVDLLATGYSSQHVDASRLRVHVEGYLANSGEDDDYDDQVRLRVIFLDEDDAELGTLDSLLLGGPLDLSRCPADDTRWHTPSQSTSVGGLEG